MIKNFNKTPKKEKEIKQNRGDLIKIFNKSGIFKEENLNLIKIFNKIEKFALFSYVVSRPCLYMVSHERGSGALVAGIAAKQGKKKNKMGLLQLISLPNAAYFTLMQLILSFFDAAHFVAHSQLLYGFT